jgi:hypothetical protein
MSGEVSLIQHYAIKFVSDLGQASGFLWVLRPVYSANKTDCHDITEIFVEIGIKHLNCLILSMKQ